MTVMETVTDDRAPARPARARFAVFSAIGGGVFLGGLGLQAALTGRWHVLPVISYVVQAVVSIEASFALNRWLTWRDRGGRLWPALARFNAQKAVTIALNLALYALLIRLRVNYLLANAGLTGVFTAVNYVAGDRLVFRPAGRPLAAAPEPARALRGRHRGPPEVSVVIPCRNNQATIRETVLSLLRQDYPQLSEILLIGSPGDATFAALAGLADPRLAIREVAAPPGIRDANFKRDAGIRMAAGELIALVDSDIVLPPDWARRAVAVLRDSGASVVAGGMRSAHDTFWGRFTDSTLIGAKTPRITESYQVTRADFGVRGRKPPITANTLFTRDLYQQCPIDPAWSHGSYEDYEWFWRITKAGHRIHVSRDLFGWHHHRRGLRALAREYRRSSRGCAYFIRAHRDSPLARRRLRQAVLAPVAGLAVAGGAAAAVLGGYSTQLATLLLISGAAVATHQVASSRRLESVAYPMVGAAMGLVFTAGLVASLVRPQAALRGEPAPAGAAPAVLTRPGRPGTRPRPRLWHPLTAVLALQASLSLSLVWSSTASSGEADGLWLGHLVLAHWRHGSSWPAAYGQDIAPGSPLIYPPLGALADSLGGLAAARILSLAFMLGATGLLWLCARRLLGFAAASSAAALWAVSEPALKLGALATGDPLSVGLAALAAFLIVQAGVRRRRAELVAAAGMVLGLAAATAYSGLVITSVVIAFAVVVWRPSFGFRSAAYCAGWLTAVSALSCFALMTVSRSWRGLILALVTRPAGGGGLAGLAHLAGGTWTGTGLILLPAIAGAVLAAACPGRRVLVPFLASTIPLLLLAQGHDQATAPLDQDLACGAWFAAMAAGYLCAELVTAARLARRAAVTTACAGLMLAYPAVTGLDAARQDFHSPGKPAVLAPVAARAQGDIHVPGRPLRPGP